MNEWMITKREQKVKSLAIDDICTQNNYIKNYNCWEFKLIIIIFSLPLSLQAPRAGEDRFVERYKRDWFRKQYKKYK